MKGDSRKLILPALVAIIAALVGFWMARDVVGVSKRDEPASPVKPRPVRQLDAHNRSSKSPARHPSKSPVDLRDLLLGVPNERIVRFKSDQAYQDFLAKLDGSGLRLLGRLDQLRALRIGFDDLDALERILGDDDESASNYLVSIPELPEVGAQPGAVGFGRSTLEWLGIDGDNSSWGDGIRIAMLDTGIGASSAFPNGVREIDLVTRDEPVALHGHGTAVASLMVGANGVTQGIAPAADLLSVRIADEAGASNSFLLAEGIVRAVDEGAQIINISMGSYGDSAMVRDAVQYAVDSDVLIVAASGNEGLDTPAFPAAYEGVLSVGAIDANGQHLDFSNSGETLGLTAPGYEIAAAWLDDQLTGFSGTSASTPIVAASIAAAASEFGPMPIAAATEIVINNLNAAGPPGDDPYYGEGIIDVGRVMNSETPGIYDGAIASNYYVGPTEEEPVGRLLVTVENRGTEILSNTRVDITVPDGTFPMNVPSLAPGETQVLTLPVNAPTSAESISIRSGLTLSGGVNDEQPANDVLTGEIVLITPEPYPVPAETTPAPGQVFPLPESP